MVGQERTVLPLLAEQEFGLAAFTAALTFIVAFGIVKAATNFFAGTLSDRYGRKPVLVAGWLIGLPVPLLLIWAPTWGWIIVANVLLGINQGLTWSTTVIMKIDLVGPATPRAGHGLQRGRRLRRRRRSPRWPPATSPPAHGLRPEPFYLGLAFAGARPRPVDAVRPRDPRPRPPRSRTHIARQRRRRHAAADRPARSSSSPASASRRCRRPARPGWSTTSTTGSPGACSRSCSPPPACASPGSASSSPLYPAVWGLGQLVTGALSDRWAANRSSPPGCSSRPPAIG